MQLFKQHFFRKLAKNQHYRLLPSKGKRGDVFDTNGKLLASSINYYSLFADPAMVQDPENLAKVLAEKLGLPQDDLYQKLSKKKRFVWVMRKMSWDKKEKIQALNLEGIGFLREAKRVYPQDSILAQVLGLVNIDNQGIEGLELLFDQQLGGKDGWVRVLHDSRSRSLFLSPQILNPKPGADIFLTIDLQIQYWVEKYLKDTIENFSAKQGSVIVLDALDGAILGLANYPVCNLNSINSGSLPFLKNMVVTDLFEPGSVFKVVTLIAAVEKGMNYSKDKIFCENGEYKIPGTILHDWKPYANLTFEEVFMKSSNIGVSKIAQQLGQQNIYSYIKKLGFGEKTGVDLPGEISAKLKPWSKWSKTSGYIIPIGQEIGVTLIQLARMLTTVVNGGYLVKPHIVKRIVSQGYCKEAIIEKQYVIKESTSNRSRDILVKVVNDGTGQLAKVDGLVIGGKTGTAQKYDPAIHRYSPTKHRASFIGFIYTKQRPLIVAVSIDEPKKSHFGGVVAAPLFAKIAKYLGAYTLKDNKVVVRSYEYN